MNILLLGSQHGDELLGEKLHEYIVRYHPDIARQSSYMVGNPQARRHNKRFVESDLNRSYNGKHTTYEERQARRILRHIQQENFDLVLDLHTTTCVQPPCLIVSSLQFESQQFLRSSSCKKIVHINHVIANTSLIGVCPRAISIEVNKDDVSAQLLEALCRDLYRFIASRPSGTTQYRYEVTELLAKASLSEQEIDSLENFTLSPQGFYPILVGEGSYKKHTNYLGFKATKRIKVRYNKTNE